MKRLGILTSGGDSTCMNKVISTFVNYCFKNNIEPYFIKMGFYGLCNNLIEKATINDVRNIWMNAGTIIKSSRFPEFQDSKVREKAINNIKKHKLDGIFVCGGNGSYMGAQCLHKLNIPVVGLPGTIDNDINSTDLTIGFHSSLHNIVNSIKEIRITMESHNFISMIEVMGRKCVDLTVFAGIASEVDYVITHENVLDAKELAKVILKLRKTNKNSIIILVTEKLYGTNNLPSISELIKETEKIINESIRFNVLGYSQRAGEPIASDLILATQLTTFAIDEFLKGNYGFVASIIDNKPSAIEIDKAINMKNSERISLINKYINNVK